MSRGPIDEAVGSALGSPDLFRRPDVDEIFEQLRGADGLTCTGSDGTASSWAVTRYDDIVAAYANSAALSSQLGAIGEGSFRSSADSAAGRMLVASDPPRHKHLRQAMRPAFTGSVQEAVREELRRALALKWRVAAAAGECDFATDIAPELPRAALKVIFGLDDDGTEELLGLTSRMIGYRDPAVLADHPAATIDDEGIRLAYLQAEILGFFSELLEIYLRERPAVPAATYLDRRTDAVGPVAEDDIVYNLLNLAVGGNETTPHTACHGLAAILSDDGLTSQLVRGAFDADRWVSEVIRWGSANAYVSRVATSELELAGTRIEAGDRLALWNYSGNRDPRRIAAADEFRPDRDEGGHLSFGTGIHRCIGQMLGIVEIRTLLESIEEAAVTLSLRAQPELLRSNFIRGVTCLELEVTSR